MVSSKGNKSRKSSSMLRRAFLLRVRSRGAGKENIMTFFDLAKSPGIVVTVVALVRRVRSLKREYLRGDWDVATVNYRCPTIERVRLKRHVVSTTAIRQLLTWILVR